MNTRYEKALWWLAGAALWTGFALLEILQSTFASNPWTTPSCSGHCLVLDRLIDWYSYGVFVPFLVFATHRWPLDRRHVAARLPLHLGLVFAIVILRNTVVRPLFNGAPPQPIGPVLAANVITEAIAIAALDGVLHAIEFYRRYRDREALTLQLRANLSDARLLALRAQLNPHFLFNTLNGATALLYRDPRAADRMLTALSEVLRCSLRSNPTHETPLREEMEVLERYLDIMRVRFSDRVVVDVSVAPDVVDALVPSFLLQPIVENAFEHGLADLDRASYVRIDARRAGEKLVLVVRDNGRGLREESHDNGSGVGLANTRRRLAELYGNNASLELKATDGGGMTAEVRLPLHRASSPA